MRTFDIDWMLNEIVDVFATYIYPVVDKIMIGEVRSVSVNIFTKGSREKDVFARTKLRNKEVISIYRVDIWLEDIMRLCREHKMFLTTEEVFQIAVLYYILHPLYTTKFMESPSQGEIFDSIYAAATDRTNQTIIRRIGKLSYIQSTVLDILKFSDMVYCNRSFDLEPGESPLEHKLMSINRYREYMLKHHKQAYHTAVKFKANYYQVDHDGFFVLESAKSKIHTSYIIEKELEFGDSLGIAINPTINWEG